ncbi:MAG: hypothetical protein OEY23_23015 [Acidimicrobiia bacterium]|nr:hypothetical protein [Acidimicrobiia bacterium]
MSAWGCFKGRIRGVRQRPEIAPGAVGVVTATAAGIARRPGLWPTALRTGARLAPRSWWRHRPFLPVPAPDYLRFRLHTMYGEAAGPVRAEDVIGWLRWCRDIDTARARADRAVGAQG